MFFILFSLEKFFKTGNFFLFVPSKVYLFRKLFSDAKIWNSHNIHIKNKLFFQKNTKKIVFPLPHPFICTLPPLFSDGGVMGRLRLPRIAHSNVHEWSLILMFMNVLELDERQTDDRLGFIHCCSIFVLADESWPLPSRHSLLSPPSPSPSCLSPPLFLSKRNNNILFLSLIEIKEITK